MSTSPLLYPQLGRGVIVKLTPTFLSSGVWSVSSMPTYQMLAVIETFDETYDLETEDIRGMDIFQRNPVPVGQGGGYRITEINQAKAKPAANSVSNAAITYGNFLRSALDQSFFQAIEVNWCTVSNYASPGGVQYSSLTTGNVWERLSGIVLFSHYDATQARQKGTTTATFEFIANIDNSAGAIAYPVVSAV